MDNQVIILKENENLENYKNLENALLLYKDKYYYKGIEIEDAVIQHIKTDAFIYDINSELVLIDEPLNKYLSRRCAIAEIEGTKKIVLNDLWGALKCVISYYDPLVIALSNYEYEKEPECYRSRPVWDLKEKGYVKYNLFINTFTVTNSGIERFKIIYRNLPFEYDNSNRACRYWFAHYLNQYILDEKFISQNEKHNIVLDNLEKIKFYKQHKMDKKQYLMNILAQELVREEQYLKNKEITK